MTLTILAAKNSADTSVIDRLGIETQDGGTDSLLPPGESLLPPAEDGSPLVPPTVE